MKHRSESSFGIHFDFHALPGQAVPTHWDPEAFAEMLDAVKPDFVQCDTKGHAGLSSYPTNAGTRADFMTQDILRMMRDETQKRGIALYGHHSGIFDQKAVALHPEWAVISATGEASRDVCSVFSPFADELLIPQLRELAGDYHLDGAWIDGECWALHVDYSQWAVGRYLERMHHEPPRPGEAGYASYREFCRQGFIDYVRHYISVIKGEFPQFQITSNWIYSAMMPEAMQFHPDFLSGDYSTSNSPESARHEGRVVEARNLTWDLMAWGHNALPCDWRTRNRNTKELGQYCQEAAVIVAMGGCFEFFNILYGHGGTVQRWAIPIWQATAEFCRQRQECFQAHIRPELGIVYPAERNSLENDSLYSGNPGTGAMRQWLRLLQDSQYSTKVVFEHQLTEDGLSRHKVLVLPNARHLSSDAVAGLERFVASGGILVADAFSASLLPDYLTGLEASCDFEDKLVFIEGEAALTAGEVPCAKWKPLADGCAEISAWMHDDNYFEAAQEAAAWQHAYGNGRVCVLSFSMQHFYEKNRSTPIRAFIRHQLAQAGYSPAVTVTGSSYAEVTVTEKGDDEVLVNIVNFAGCHNVSDVRGYDEIPPIGPLEIRISAALPVESLRLIPGGQPLPFTRGSDSSVTVTLPRVEIHAAVVAKVSHATA